MRSATAIETGLNFMQMGDGINIRLPEREGKRFGVVGKSGAGKTNTMLVKARKLINAGWTVIVIDPMNQFRRLRDAGLPVVVAGGRDSADVKLTPGNAAKLAGISFDERLSMVLEMSMYANDMDVLQPFLEALWRRILHQHEDGPFVRIALLIDEAQMYIPQNGKTEVSGLILDMGKRGRQLHLSMVVASQRPASVQKDFLTQSNVMIFHQLRGVDIGPVKSELAIPEKEAIQLMKGFVKGQAIVSGDSDMIELGDEDYVLGRVEEWQGVTAVESVGVAGEQRVIDETMLERMRELVAVNAEVEKTPVAQPVQKALVLPAAPDNKPLWRIIAVLTQRNRQLHQIATNAVGSMEQAQAISEQLRIENRTLHEKVKGQTVKQSWSIPGVEIEGRVDDRGNVKITRQTTHIETIETSHQSSRQIAIKTKRQEAAFGELLNEVRELRTDAIAVLLEVMTSKNGFVRLDDVAMEYDYALTTVRKGIANLTRTGLVTRTDSGDVESCVDYWLSTNFPVLNVDQLRARLLQTVESRLDR